ncbi:anthocyanidin reductase ((2S)-flavan-3-ol-forming)-like [Telopea speciosissima]|uniref:anthocyanidin reductase ((2S)-flavan-3-ol-forming)-like n=1 Tax=Telopea speciosissima TaxID=54955 RepID=UPI001CC339DF|nr:anthocyanidin reductase ((2S)-flavan-3-ol-forming)-like [Telopea speciosissima]
MEEQDSRHRTVCVTGGAGYIGSSLVKKLLEKGHTVHATLRNLDDHSKVGLLKNFPEANTKLRLFKADIYNPDEFNLAIQGCDFVFHVATPFQNSTQSSQYKDTTKAAVASVESIVKTCLRSGTVKRLIYTASVMAASPWKEDGSGFKDSMDESCWTPLDLPNNYYRSNFLKDYTFSKTIAEKKLLNYECKENKLELVSLACGLVGGDTVLSYIPASLGCLMSQPLNDPNSYQSLEFLQELLGKVPIVHIDDVCEAHIFCMDQWSLQGRFLCASDFITTKEVADYFCRYHPDICIADEFLGRHGSTVRWGSTKLNDVGFKHSYDAKLIFEDSFQCLRKMGAFE